MENVLTQTPTDAKPAGETTPGTPATGTPVAKPEEAKDEYIVAGKKILLTKEQAKVAVQKGLFADQKLKSLDVLKKSTETLIGKLKTPEGLLEILKDPALGASPKEVFKKLLQSDIIDDELKESMSEWVYKNVVKPSKQTPEEIDRDRKLQEYEKLKMSETHRKEAEAKEKESTQVNQVYQAIRGEVTKQIVADKTFPQTEGSIRQVIEKLRVMNKQNTPITTETITKALGLVKKDHILHQQALLDAITNPEELVNLIGEERALKISRALIERIKAKAKTVETKPAADTKDKTTDRIDKKLGRTPSGYSIMDV